MPCSVRGLPLYKVWTGSGKVWVSQPLIKLLISAHPFLSCNHRSYPRLCTHNPQLSTTCPQLGVKSGNSDKCLKSLRLTSLLFDSGGELVDLVIDRTALSHQLTDLSIGVHNRCVVTPTKCLADLRQ